MIGSGANQTTFGRSDFQEILANFSPLSKGRAKMPSLPQSGEIDLLIATDCISEGQNLQDAALVVNYDIHWNPVRLIQRFGRVDRLGSKNASVQMVNFWPTRDLDQYINVKSRVEARMALVDVTATGYDGLLDPHDIQEVLESDLHYRDKQLLRLKDEVLDLEDLTESVTLSEFTLDDFRMDLHRFIEANRKRLEEAPMGLYACVPASGDVSSVIKPGVIFCLCQKEYFGGKASEKVNPTAPYFLVYIQDDGVVRYNFVHPKQVLDMFRLLCLGKAEADDALCEAFDLETGDGKNMARYSELLQKSVRAIQSTFQKRDLGNLFSGRGAKVTKASERPVSTDDFELITWLVIR